MEYFSSLKRLKVVIQVFPDLVSAGAGDAWEPRPGVRVWVELDDLGGNVLVGGKTQQIFQVLYVLYGHA